MAPNYAFSRNKKPYFYYRCTKVSKADKNACKIRRTNARELERLILDRIKFLASEKQAVEKIIKEARKQQKTMLPTLESELKTLSGQLRKVKDSINNLLEIPSLKDNASAQNKIRSLDTEKQALEKRQAEIEVHVDGERRKVLNLELIQNNFNAFNLIFKELSFEEQWELLRTIIKKITCNEPPSEIKIEFWNLPEIKMPPKAPAKGTSGGTFSRFDKERNGSPKHSPQRPFFEVEFPIALYRVLKGAWKIGDPNHSYPTSSWPLKLTASGVDAPAAQQV